MQNNGKYAKKIIKEQSILTNIYLAENIGVHVQPAGGLEVLPHLPLSCICPGYSLIALWAL